MQNIEQPKRNTNSLTDNINFFACILMCMWFTLPYFRIRAGVASLILFFAVWLVTTGLRWLIKGWRIDMVFVIVFFLTFLPYFLTGNINYGKAGPQIILVHFPLFFVGIFINHYYMYYKKDYKTLGKIVTFTIFFIFIGSIQTYSELLKNPLASRILGTAGTLYETEKIAFNQSGVGGYGYIYACSFFFIGLLFLLLLNYQNISKTMKVIIPISMFCLVLMIIEAAYAIALMLLVSGIILALMIKSKKRAAILMILFILFLLFIPSNLIGEFFIYIANIFSDNFIINEKFTDLGMSLLLDSQGSQTSTRINLYVTSLNTFIRQPIFGIYGPMGNDFATVGAHSSWFDLLAYYGLFSGIPLGLIFYYNFKKHLNFYKENKYYGYLIVIFFLLIILGIINPVLYVYEVGFIIFMVIPIIPFISQSFSLKYGMKNSDNMKY